MSHRKTRRDLPNFLKRRLKDLSERHLKLGIPCPYMFFDPNGYHLCAILNELDKTKHPEWTSHRIMCVWYHSIAFDIGTWEKNLQGSCPLGYTFEEIDAKIQLLLEKVDWDNRPIDNFRVKED